MLFGALETLWPTTFHVLERRRVALPVGVDKTIIAAAIPMIAAGSVIEREIKLALAYCTARINLRDKNHEEGHGAPSRASVAKGVLLHHGKYTTS
jgi:hypothetical protein